MFVLLRYVFLIFILNFKYIPRIQEWSPQIKSCISQTLDCSMWSPALVDKSLLTFINASLNFTNTETSCLSIFKYLDDNASIFSPGTSGVIFHQTSVKFCHKNRQNAELSAEILLSSCLQVVAEDSYLNEVQNSGKWEAMLLSVHLNRASLQPASSPSHSISSHLLYPCLSLWFNPHSDSDSHETPLLTSPLSFIHSPQPCSHTLQS